jgi:hypothetical protein
MLRWARFPRFVASADPEAARAVQAITADYRARLKEIVERAALPHFLPAPGPEALRDAGPSVTAEPRAFKPMGYTCRGESGSFTLRRRTAANLTVDLHLDGGAPTVLAMFRVWGLGFKGCFRFRYPHTHGPARNTPLAERRSSRRVVGVGLRRRLAR